MKTATNAAMRMDLRARRAQVLMHNIMHLIDEHICDHDRERNHRREVADKLMELFHTEGVEIVTDHTRAEAGLPPRGLDGWTVEELMALEQRRLEIMRAPILKVDK